MIPIRNNIYLHFSVSNCLTLDSETIDSVLPLQVRPSPKYPGLHEQLKEPLVLLQTAFSLQSCVPEAHSSISENNLS